MNEQNNQSQNTKPVVTLTEAAVDKVKSMMKRDGKEGSGLRVGVVTGGCAGMSYEMRFQKNPYDNDIKFKQGDLEIYLNADSIAMLMGVEIDYIDTLRESGFQYKNPNASSSCGCGVSFS